MLLQDISNLIRLSQIMVQFMHVIISEFCYICFKVECKRSYIFQSSSNETLIIELKLRSMQPMNCGFRSLKGSLFF